MPLILGTNSIKDTGYDVANSLRFNRGSSDHLTFTPSSTGNRRTFTISFWTKIGEPNVGGNEYGIFDAGGDSNVVGWFVIQQGHTSDGDFMLQFYAGGSPATKNFKLEQDIRDPNAWYNFVIAVDSTQSTDSNRIKWYLNGNQITDFNITNYPSQNFDFFVNTSGKQQTIGGRANSTGSIVNHYDGYISEFVMIDGLQLDPTSFGEFDEDSGIWKPIDVSGLTFGTNGFYLDFENSGSLGADVSGNGNNFTVNNLTAIDQSISTPTNIFATWNPLASSSQATLSEGNLKAVGNSTDDGNVFCNMVPKSGKWYAEFKITKSNDGIPTVGIRQESSGFRLLNGTSGAVGYYQYEASVRPDGQRYTNNSTVSWGGSTFVTGSIIGIALDCDNGAGYISVNGTYMNSGDPTSGGSKTGAFITWTEAQAQYGGQTFASRIYTTSSGIEANFGSPPYSESGGNSDGNGYGNFASSVPANYYCLNTKNLAEYG